MTLKSTPRTPRKQKNPFIKHAHISQRKFKLIIRLFSEDLPASKIAVLTGISRPTINKILQKIRIKLAAISEQNAPFKGEVEADESYFGARRVRGKKGRGACGKTIVFGILEREQNVYAQIIPNCKKKTLQDIIKGRVDAKSVIYTDGWPGYKGLVDVGYDKHFRVRHSENEFAKGRSHINGIESFWSFAKRRLSKFNGIPKHRFYFHLKESEFRFNNRKLDLEKKILNLCKENPL